MSKFAERYRAEGFKKGLELTRQWGMRKGAVNVVSRQLETKYGARALASYRDRLEQADIETLMKWAERTLTADSIEEVFH